MSISGCTSLDIGYECGNNDYNIMVRLENPLTREYL